MVQVRVLGVALDAARQHIVLLKPLLAPEPTSEQARIWRAIEVLEQVGTPEAQAVLEAVAATSTRGLSREARAALARLAKKAETP